MPYDLQDTELDPGTLRRRAAQCARLSRVMGGIDAAMLEALAREYEREARKLEERPDQVA